MSRKPRNSKVETVWGTVLFTWYDRDGGAQCSGAAALGPLGYCVIIQLSLAWVSYCRCCCWIFALKEVKNIQQLFGEQWRKLRFIWTINHYFFKQTSIDSCWIVFWMFMHLGLKAVFFFFYFAASEPREHWWWPQFPEHKHQYKKNSIINSNL